jgi:hypothetical protein
MNKVVNAFRRKIPGARALSCLRPAHTLREPLWLFAPPVATFVYSHPMPTSCQIAGCKSTAPHALEEQKLCVLHYTLSLEASCSEMRRETALGNTPHDRQREIMRFITESGERLARVATSGMALTDDLKARILSTFLTLMNLRENLDRASMRTPPGRSGAIR